MVSCFHLIIVLGNGTTLYNIKDNLVMKKEKGCKKTEK